MIVYSENRKKNTDGIKKVYRNPKRHKERNNEKYCWYKILDWLIYTVSLG